MIEKLYGLVDFAAAGILLFGGVPAPAILLYACSAMLLLKGMLSFIPIPIYMPGILMCGADVVAAVLLVFSGVALPIKIAIISVLLLKSFPGIVLSLLGK